MSAIGPYPDLLTRITNGLGGRVHIQYAPMTDPAVYQRAAPSKDGHVESQCLIQGQVSGSAFYIGTPPAAAPSFSGAHPVARVADFPSYLLSSFTHADGLGATYRHSVTYRRSLFDLQRRTLLGFEKVSHTDESQKTKAVTTYHQGYPNSGAPAQMLCTRTPDGAWMHKKTYTYATRPGAAKNITTVECTQTVDHYFNFAKAGPPAPKPEIEHTINRKFDDYGNALTVVDSTGPTHRYTYDKANTSGSSWYLGKIISAKTVGPHGTLLRHEKRTYDQAHRLASRSRQHITTGAWLTSTYTYDAVGNVVSETDPYGAESKYAYDSIYRTFVTSHTSPPNSENKPIVVALEHEPFFGRLTARYAARVGATSTQVVLLQHFDGFGRLATRKCPTPADPTGRPVTIESHRWKANASGTYVKTETAVDWGGTMAWSRQYLDGMGRHIRTESLGPDGITETIVDRTFDGHGRILSHSLPYYRGASRALVVNTYDAYGRLTTRKTPLETNVATETKIEWTGRFEAVETRAAESAAPRHRTIAHRIICSRQHLASVTDAAGHATTYAYDALGQCTSVEDPIGVVTSITYDSLGRKSSIVVHPSQDPGRHYARDTYHYADDSRRLTTIDAARGKIVRKMDKLGRLVSLTTTDDSCTYTWDAGTWGAGRLTGAQNRHAKTAYVYDVSGHPKQVATSVTADASKSYAFKHTYLPDGRLEQTTYPDGASQTRNYNRAASLSSIRMTEKDGGKSASLEFDGYTSEGMCAHQRWGEDTATVHQTTDFDLARHPRKQTVQTKKASAAILDCGYTWDALGQLTALSDPRGGHKLTYDTVGRLIGRDGGGGAHNFSYDKGGNTLSNGAWSYTYQGHQLTTGKKDSDKLSVSYDANGSMTRLTMNGKSSSFSYDVQHRLTAAGHCRFVYDAHGRRIGKQESRSGASMTTRYIAPDYEVVELTNGDRQHSRYIIVSGRRLAVTTTADKGSGNRIGKAMTPGIPVVGAQFYVQDHLRSTLLVTDSEGASLAALTYTPYGTPTVVSGSDLLRYKFNGMELDAATGLYDFKARYLNPSLGRFMTADDRRGGPLGMHDIYNRYAFGLKSPAVYSDPSGHMSEGEEIAIGIGFIFVDIAAIGLTVATAGAAAPVAIGMGALTGAAFGVGTSGAIYAFHAADTGEAWNAGAFDKDLWMGAATGAVGGAVAAGVTTGITAAVSAWGAEEATVTTESAALQRIWSAQSQGTKIASTFGRILTGGFSSGVSGAASWGTEIAIDHEGFSWGGLTQAFLIGAGQGIVTNAGSEFAKFTGADKIPGRIRSSFSGLVSRSRKISPDPEVEMTSGSGEGGAGGGSNAARAIDPPQAEGGSDGGRNAPIQSPLDEERLPEQVQPSGNMPRNSPFHRKIQPM